MAGDAAEQGSTLRTSGAAVPMLKKRADFLRLAGGVRVSAAALAIQAGPAGAGPGRLGLTVTKKCGSAPARNRIRRRLRAAAQQACSNIRPDIDVVVLGRPATLAQPFDRLVAELSQAIVKAQRRLTVPSPAAPAETPRPSA